MKKVKYLDKNLLRRINEVSEKLFHFNRTIPEAVIDALPDDKFFIITFTMMHEHIAGKPADPHVRCMIYTGPDSPYGQLILDMEPELYNLIPEHTVEDDPSPELVEEPAAT